MTTNNSTQTLTVAETDLKKIESFTSSLLAMADAYDLPESFEYLLNDLADKAETIRMSALLDKELKPKLVEASS